MTAMFANARRSCTGGIWITGQRRAAALQAARDWHHRNKPKFDAMDQAGMFADSVREEWPIRPRSAPAG